ncbi:MAG: hypothetical protein MJ192_08675 [Clostridia bacterium]|nr:hypothetical protein [Clostridia bacterium]
MTINSCLTLVDAMAPNRVERSVKRRWLEELDAQVRVELWGETPDEQTEPAGAEDGTRVLSAPYPFDRLYWLYLASLVDYINGDTARYENGAMLFNAAYCHYAKYVIRNRGRGDRDECDE